MPSSPSSLLSFLTAGAKTLQQGLDPGHLFGGTIGGRYVVYNSTSKDSIV